MGWNWLTGFADWFTGGEKKVPEELVYGAKLRCLQGSQDTYLIVNHTYKRIEGLPAACVLDRVEFDNIMPFGVCRQNGYCRDLMKLRTRWDNDKPQDILLNGEEVITTESVLICERCGGMIWAVNSGQDGKGAEWLTKELAFIERMMRDYPGLLEVMYDPNGSIYLTEGMYDIAMQFIRDCWQNSGCNMDIISLFNQSDPEGTMMRNVLERLLPGFDLSGVDKFRDDLLMKGTEKGYDGVLGWNVDILNQEMFSLLEEECKATKKRMEEDPFYRWQEEHRDFMYTLSDAATILSYHVVANKGLGTPSENPTRKVTGKKVVSNLGNEIDITPSDNHTTVPKNPGPKGTPNSSIDILDSQGNIATRRWFDSNGNAYRDVDLTNHGNPTTHPEYPHVHTWDWSGSQPLRSK